MTVVPDVNRGLVEVTSPSTRSGSGVVNTSSVGMLGWCSMPSAFVNLAASQVLDGSSPMLRSVPGPTNCTRSRLRSLSAVLTRVSSASRDSHAAIGSGSSSRVTCAISVHSRSSAAGGSSLG